MNRSLLKHQLGVGLIEVLITLLILSTALMGLATLQSRSLQYNQGSYYRSQANILASDILDRMRLYTFNANVWAGNASAGLPKVSAEAALDIKNWQQSIATNLPDGEGVVSCVMATRICTATISWSNQNYSGQESENKSKFAYSAKL